MTAPTNNEQPRLDIFGWLKKNFTSLIGLIIAIGVMVAIIIYYLKYPDFYERLQGYGYLGAFVVSILLNGTILLPVSNVAVITALGATLPVPALVGVAGGLGAGIGELSG